ncbi:MAG: methyltransferase domain-containing protein [Proteobacteria bacterium]|nr:methyltransferase domain-containing protein [Pseudomonadota bacterium]
METSTPKTLSAGHRKALGDKKNMADAPPAPVAVAESPAAPPANLDTIPAHIRRKAWFTLAHLLLSPGALVADMGCGDGALTHAMAALRPEIKFIGVDQDKKAVSRARQTYKLPNLEFRAADISGDGAFDPGSLDAIVNSFILHEVYSASRYNDQQVSRTLERQFSLLKTDGQMFIRDYALQYPGEYVLMEMPAAPDRGKDIQTMTETDLLLWYADHARPKEDPGCHGFFIEEIAARFPQTRLFRLPYKWAYEFIMRKDSRATLKDELHKEYTYFTQRDFRRALRALGARVFYTAPQWDEKIIAKRFKGRFRLYDDNGQALGMPPTSFIAVAHKVRERTSLILGERRPSSKQSGGALRVTAMRNERTGRIMDVVSRDIDITEIIPYRITGKNQLFIYLHEGLPRGIVNAVPRAGREIDGKRWSGHMVEAISVPTDAVVSADKGELKETVIFSRDYLGLKPAMESRLEEGPAYYPAPDYIDDLIKTRYLRVTEREDISAPRSVPQDASGFSTTGKIREINAQEALDAIAVGMIPNARLELQILELYGKLGLKAQTWQESPLTLTEIQPETMFDAKNFVTLKASGDTTFKTVKGSAGQLRAVQSTFVDEGWVGGGMAGLAARDIEFVVSDDKTLNKAVILPLGLKDGNVLMGMEVEYLPVPQRHQGNGLSLKAPSVILPKEVTDIYQAKRYIADLFEVSVDEVWRLGESYFCHTGVTPVRVFPFAVAAKGKCGNPIGGPVQFAPMDYIWNVIDKVLDWKHDTNFISAVKKGYNFLAYGSDLNLKWAAGRDAFYQLRGHDVLNVAAAESPSAVQPAASKDNKASAPQEERKIHIK